MKKCSKCKLTKQTSYFGKDKQNRSGLKSWCNSCMSADSNARNKRNLEKTYEDRRVYKFKYKYGITVETYNKMFEEQEGKCAICGKHQVELNKVLGIDHCHDGGFVRGLLCRDCNLQLGRFEAGRLTTFSELYEACQVYVSSEGVEYTFPI